VWILRAACGRTVPKPSQLCGNRSARQGRQHVGGVPNGCLLKMQRECDSQIFTHPPGPLFRARRRSRFLPWPAGSAGTPRGGAWLRQGQTSGEGRKAGRGRQMGRSGGVRELVRKQGRGSDGRRFGPLCLDVRAMQQSSTSARQQQQLGSASQQ
jgi:hypothetical protein